VVYSSTPLVWLDLPIKENTLISLASLWKGVGEFGTIGTAGGNGGPELLYYTVGVFYILLVIHVDAVSINNLDH